MKGLRPLYLLSFILYLALVSGCGFHLRGAVELPPELAKTYLQGVAANSELAIEIEQALNRGGASLVATRKEATAVLVLHGEKTRRTILGVDRIGKAREYELSLAFSFTLKDNQLDTLVAEQRVSVEREIRYDSGNVLGNEREEENARSAMRRFAVQQMFSRLRAALASH